MNAMRQPFGDWWKAYVTYLTVEQGFAQNTVAAYRNDIKQYLNQVGDTPLDSASAERFVGYLIEQGLSAASVNRKAAAVKSFHKYLHQTGRIADPTVTAKGPKPVRRLPRVLTTLQMLKMLTASDDQTVKGRRDQALVEFLYSTACRAQELVSVNISDVNMTDGTCLVRGKGSKHRIVVLGRSCLSRMQTWLVDRARVRSDVTGPLFLNMRGRRLTRTGVWVIVKAVAEEAGVPKQLVSPHTFRHSAATHMLERGANLRALQTMLGHEQVATVELYTQVSPQRLKQVYVETHPRSRHKTPTLF